MRGGGACFNHHQPLFIPVNFPFFPPFFFFKNKTLLEIGTPRKNNLSLTFGLLVSLGQLPGLEEVLVLGLAGGHVVEEGSEVGVFV